jgi:hypothetical protein
MIYCFADCRSDHLGDPKVGQSRFGYFSWHYLVLDSCRRLNRCWLGARNDWIPPTLFAITSEAVKANDRNPVLTSKKA